MNDLNQDIGLVRREVKDLRGLTSNLDRRVLRLVEPSTNHTAPASHPKRSRI